MGGFFAAAAAIAGLLVWNTQASAKEPLGRQWPNGQYVSMDKIDHSSNDSLLKKYVDKIGLLVTGLISGQFRKRPQPRLYDSGNSK